MVRFTYIYRLFDAAGILLYIGMTRDLAERLIQHERDRGSDWAEVASMTVATYTSYYDATDAERRAIDAEQPLWNVARYRVKPRTAAPRVRVAAAAPIPLESVTQRRARAYAALCEMGGWRRTGEVAEHMGRSPAFVRQRLGELAARGLIERSGDNRATRYRAMPSRAAQTRENIYAVICLAGGARTGEIAEAVERGHVLTRKRIQELIDEGRVVQEGDGPATRYVPA